MIWWHEKILRHTVRRTEIGPRVLWDGSSVDKRTLVSCSCKRVWVRR